MRLKTIYRGFPGGFFAAKPHIRFWSCKDPNKFKDWTGRLNRKNFTAVSKCTKWIRKVGQWKWSKSNTGRDSLNQSFRQFRSRTEWISSVQPEKFRKSRSIFRGGPLFSVGPVRSKWTVPFDHSDPFSIPVPRCSVFSLYNMEGKHLSLQLLRMVNSGSIGVTRTYTSMCSHNRSVAAS